MTDDEINKLAERVASILLDSFIVQTNPFQPNETEEELLAELARLMTLLSAYLENEQYEKCAIIKNKINRIETKLGKL
jgi:protein-arginine kinase activator protein McsA